MLRDCQLPVKAGRGDTCWARQSLPAAAAACCFKNGVPFAEGPRFAIRQNFIHYFLLLCF
jgi:hypothetical protein